MEFTNEIFFNKKLTKNETVLITYSGKLYREHSAEVIIVYGYGENWDYTQEQKMTETENGFEVSIELKNYDTFNFCFRNNYNIWDNNSGFNYIASIEEKNQIEENSNNLENQNTENIENEVTKENENIGVKIVENTIKEINNNIDEEIAKTISQIHENSEITNNNFETGQNDNSETIKDESEIKNEMLEGKAVGNEIIEESQTEEKQIKIIEGKEEDKEIEIDIDIDIDIDKEIEETFNDLLNSMLKSDEPIDSHVDYENGFGLQSVDEINEISSTECNDEILQELYENNPIENNKNLNVQNEVSEPSELENLLNALIERQNYEQNEIENEAINVEELNKLMNNLNSIIKENTEQDLKLFEDTDEFDEFDDFNESDESKFKISELPATQKNSEDLLDNFIDKSYNFFQKVWIGCKKIGMLIKRTAKNLLGEE